MIGERGKQDERGVRGGDGEEEEEEAHPRQKLERKRDHVFVFLSLRRHDDSARLPKLCLDLNRSRLEKYLLCPADSAEIFYRSRGIFLEGYIDSLLRRHFFLVRLANEYHCRNCIANQYEIFMPESVVY